MYQSHPPLPWETLPTMYDLPSEDPEEPGLPDKFHDLQSDLLSQTCNPDNFPWEQIFIAKDLNLYYDPRHPRWYKRPDWFLVTGVPRSAKQQELRLSYVIWQEGVVPFLVVELLSPGTENEDLGETLREEEQPPTKWEVYESILRIPYYVIYDRYKNNLRAFRLEGTSYQPLLLPDKKLWLEELQLGLGLWHGSFEGTIGLWLRFYDAQGNWIPTPAERAERAEKAQRESIPRLLKMGLTVAQVAEALGISVEDVKNWRQD